MGTGLGIALFVVSTASTLYAAKQQKKAIKEESRANERRERAEQKRANAHAARERAKVLRQGRIARAQATASATGDDASGGSALAGVRGSIQGQVVGNQQFLNENLAISKQISELNISSGRRIAKFKSRAAIGGAVAGVSGQGAGLFGVN